MDPITTAAVSKIAQEAINADKTAEQLGNVINRYKGLFNEYFIGRYDLKMECNGKSYICDFKTSKGVWFENILQLVAYRMVEKTDGIAVIHIPQFKIRYIDIIDYIPYEEVLKNLSSIYNLKKQIIPINPYYNETKYN